jgi:selenocysteine-specific elongation factor
VRFHVGTAEVMGSVSLLDSDAVPPGGWALAQVFLDEPVTAVWGQPFVVRGPSATQTLGGGQVLQPVAKKVRRRHLDVLERIETLWSGGSDERALGSGRHRLLHADMVKELDERILTVLGRLHQEFPLMTTHDRQKVQSQLDYVGDDALVHAAVDRLIAQKRLAGDLRRVARADFKPKLSANLRKLKDKVVADYQQARFAPPDPSAFAGAAGGNAANLRDLFDVCVAEGFLVHVTGDIYLHSEAEAEMRRLVTEKLAGGTGMTVAEIRDLLGTTRKFAVPLCEYLDRVGVTKREGDLRLIGSRNDES